MSAAYSPGWGARVELGPGQERTRQALVRSIRHPSRTWHQAPAMRGYGTSPSTAHRLVHRLAALGVIAIQTTLGSEGGTRFTFGVRYWRRSPVRRGLLFRLIPSPGQLGLDPPRELELPAPLEPEPPEPIPHPHAHPSVPETFAEKLRRHGLDEEKFWKIGWK